MRRSTLTSALITSAAVLVLSFSTGCNTVKGAGEDIKATGQAGEDAIKKVTKDGE